MRTALVIVLAVVALALAWVFGLTLNLSAGFGVILLAVAAERVHTGKRRAPRETAEHDGSIVALPERGRHPVEVHHERARVA